MLARRVAVSLIALCAACGEAAERDAGTVGAADSASFDAASAADAAGGDAAVDRDGGSTQDGGPGADAGAGRDAAEHDGGSAQDGGSVQDGGVGVDGGAGRDVGAGADAAVARDAGTSDGAVVIGGLSDPFDGTSLDLSWTVLHPELVDLTVGGGELSMRATRYSLWFNASQGAFVYKHATGSFRATSTVHARRASDARTPPADRIHLGGLMARNPDTVLESYVFIVLGQDENDRSIETKTTRDGASTYAGPAWPTGDAQLRICRLGDTFRLYKREPGAPTWTLATTYARPDMPATLEVGLNLYAASNTPDLRVTWDELELIPAPDLSTCEAP